MHGGAPLRRHHGEVAGFVQQVACDGRYGSEELLSLYRKPNGTLGR
jgi:hypothetical protein